jgi:hypothetical protein
MTCTNCKKLELENKKLREKVEIMERVRDIHIAQIEERYEAMLDQAKEYIQNCLAGRRMQQTTLGTKLFKTPTGPGRPITGSKWITTTILTPFAVNGLRN